MLGARCLSAAYRKKFLVRSLSLSRNNEAICWPKSDYGPMEVMRSDLMNGIKVASAKPLGAQIGACTIMFQAGSRYEKDESGASHFLRVMSPGSGCGYTNYIKGRYVQQCGGAISVSSDRQTISYTLKCPITCFSDLKNYLLDTAARICYHPWEIDDCRSFVKDDLSRRSSEQLVMDLIQKASFSGSLANSVFCPRGRIDEMTREKLSNFIHTNYLSTRCSVGSVGMPFEETLKMAERIQIRREKPHDPCCTPSCPKRGYEYYDLGACSDTWIAVAVPSCSSCDLSCLLKHNIVAAACGTGNAQVGQHETDRTPQPPLGTMAHNIFTNYQAFNISYFDHGIFGILAKTQSNSACQVSLNAAEFLQNVGDLDFQQIDVGKQRLKLSLALHDEDCVQMAEGLALQVANNIQIDSAKNAMALIDLIPNEEISATAKMLSSKSDCMTLAVVGDVGVVPPGAEMLCA